MTRSSRCRWSRSLAATFTIPDSSQTETWVDGNGAFFSGWPYSATITVRPAGSLPVTANAKTLVAANGIRYEVGVSINGELTLKIA